MLRQCKYMTLGENYNMKFFLAKILDILCLCFLTMILDEKSKTGPLESCQLYAGHG